MRQFRESGCAAAVLPAVHPFAANTSSAGTSAANMSGAGRRPVLSPLPSATHTIP
jgi:hypothetical protein